MDQPFLGSVAVRQGEYTRRELGTKCSRLYRGVYVDRAVEVTAAIRARAAWTLAGGTLSGISAAALHGTKWLEGSWSAQIIRRDRHRQTGLIVYSWTLHPGETTTVDGMPVTTPARTAFDLGRLLPRARSIPLIDALMNATGLTAEAIAEVADAHPRERGVRRLRHTLTLVDGGAESPQETRVRLILVDGGLGPVETQIRALKYRIDMGWEKYKVGVEYDGNQHWETPEARANDIRRSEALRAAGWTLIRVSSAMMAEPEAIVARARAALRAAGRRI